MKNSEFVGADKTAHRVPKKYKIIYADPPWKYNKGVHQETFPKRRQTRLERELPYKTLSINEIKELPINSITDKDCACFMWVTDSHLKQGIEVLEAWNFKYRTIAFVWKKITNKGNTCATVGAWTMKNCEICLLGTKGNMLKHKVSNNIFQLIEAERTENSKKPMEARIKIDSIFPSIPRIELFARQRVEGWDAWGDEIENSPVLGEGSPAQNTVEICHTAQITPTPPRGQRESVSHDRAQRGA